MKLIKQILSLPGNIIRFFSQTIAEMKFVQWFKGRKVFSYTLTIVLFLIIGALSLIFIDKALLLLRGLVIPT